jgi:hypothetical protein
MNAHITVYHVNDIASSRTHEDVIDLNFNGEQLRIFLTITQAKELIEKMHGAIYQPFTLEEPAIPMKGKKDK